MTINFRTYDVSCPGVIEDMMIYAFIVQRALTMYDTEYWVYHSTRVSDEDGDDMYHINISTTSDKNIDDYVRKEIVEVVRHWKKTHDYCGGEVIYEP